MEFGSKDNRRYLVLDDGQTVFKEGKYYNNPDLSKLVLEIAKDKCGFEIFDTSALTGIAEAKYTFKTKDRIYECVITERNILEKNFMKYLKMLLKISPM